MLKTPSNHQHISTSLHINNTIQLVQLHKILCLITFCVSRRRRKMYCGHARLCVCPRPYAHNTARTWM